MLERGERMENVEETTSWLLSSTFSHYRNFPTYVSSKINILNFLVSFKGLVGVYPV